MLRASSAAPAAVATHTHTQPLSHDEEGRMVQQARGDAVARFMRARVALRRCKLIVVGEQRVGKTSLVKTLLGLEFDAQQQSTDGVRLESCRVTQSSWTLRSGAQEGDWGDEIKMRMLQLQDQLAKDNLKAAEARPVAAIKSPRAMFRCWLCCVF